MLFKERKIIFISSEPVLISNELTLPLLIITKLYIISQKEIIY